MLETLTDHWVDGMDFDRLPYWVDILGVTTDDIHLLGLREALKLRVVSDDYGIQAEREVITETVF